MNNTLLIAGTNTDVGKTLLTTALAAYWQTYRSFKSLALMKLMQTGVGDRELYQQLFSENLAIEILTPLHFQAPLAPPLAAEYEGKEVNLQIVWQAYLNAQKTKDFVLIEALGGLGSPVTRELTVADLARDWRFPTVLVVPVRLGGISEAIVNVSFARQCKIALRGIILSCVNSDSENKLADWTPPDLIQSLTNVPVIGVLPHVKATDNIAILAEVASNLDIEKLIY